MRTCYRYAPECVLAVRTSCAQFAQLLRSPVASLHAGLGITRPKCVNMLREGRVKPWRRKASRIDQVRDERARSTARKRVDLHLARAFHGVVSQIGHLVAVNSTKWSLIVVTASGHRPGIHLVSASIRGYLNGYRHEWGYANSALQAFAGGRPTSSMVCPCGYLASAIKNLYCPVTFAARHDV